MAMLATDVLVVINFDCLQMFISRCELVHMLTCPGNPLFCGQQKGGTCASHTETYPLTTLIISHGYGRRRCKFCSLGGRDWSLEQSEHVKRHFIMSDHWSI